MSAQTVSDPSTVARVLDAGAAGFPSREALVDGRHRLDYGTLHELVGRVAAGLREAGVGPGDRVAVSLPNSVHVVVLFLATMQAGATFVGVHPGLAPVEKVRLLEAAAADVVLATPAILSSVDDVGRSLPGLQVPVDLTDLTLGDIARPPRAGWAEPDPSAPAAIAFTSGTTGTPKGVVHDQQHMLLPASVILHHRMVGRGERIGVHLPLTTLNMLVLGPVLAFLGGGTCVCLDAHDPVYLAAAVRAERVEHMSTSPAVVHDLLEHGSVDLRAFAAVRLGVGGVACPERLREAYREAIGRSFTTGYGLTEAPTAVSQETERIPHRAGASGTAMAHVRIEIVDDDGNPMPPGERGEITVVAATDGPWANRFRGLHSYLDRPDETERVRRDGRLHTGDVGRVDADGYVYVEDRRDGVINRGGSKVSPLEVENALRVHPAIADCIVLGHPDDRLGESVVAAVELRAGAGVTSTDLREHCAQLLAGYKVPSTIALVDALPRNPMGKVVRSAALDLIVDARDGVPGGER
ncbi:MAG: class I adenylate-forming enzyme family protein [Ilumatobacteraceae bacterium]